MLQQLGDGMRSTFWFLNCLLRRDASEQLRDARSVPRARDGHFAVCVSNFFALVHVQSPPRFFLRKDFTSSILLRYRLERIQERRRFALALMGVKRFVGSAKNIFNGVAVMRILSDTHARGNAWSLRVL